MFRIGALEAVNGFDLTLPVCEDFDLYLRIARLYPVCCHSSVVAAYRQHGSGLSSNHALMLKTAMAVLRAQWPSVKDDARRREAYRVGLRFWPTFYGRELTQHVKPAIARNQPRQAILASLALLRLTPRFAFSKAARALASRSRRLVARAAAKMLPERIGHFLPRGNEALPLGRVRLGDLDRLTPISREFGFDRGLPVDRYYIEGFLSDNADDIAGRVLEIGDNEYTTRFGGSRVAISDILYVNDTNPKATIVADLSDAPQIGADQFDCIIITQTLHLIFEVGAALRTLHRILKPGGVLLITSPGITQIGNDPSGARWYWAFTPASVAGLLEQVFPPGSVQVESHGNVLAAVTFLHGMALEEVPAEALDYRDPAYPVIVAARAVKPTVTA